MFHEKIENLLARMKEVLVTMREHNLAPTGEKNHTRLYTMTEAAKLIGRSPPAIRAAEKDGRLQSPELNSVTRRRSGMTLAEINNAREVFGTRLQRDPELDEAIILPIQNFKGGSGKTTTATALGQYLALQGLRVLLVDCDPQASMTSTFGYIPDLHIERNQTLLPYILGEENDLQYAIQKTYWDGLDLIPSNLTLFEAEYHLAMTASDGLEIDLIRGGLETVKDNYDVIIIDPPPALGLISLNVLYSGNAMIIPMPPGLYDFYSTYAFVTMLQETVASIEKQRGELAYYFQKILVTRLDEGKPVQGQLIEFLKGRLDSDMMKHCIRDTAAVDSAGVRMQTVYELEKTASNRKTLKRALMGFDSVNAEILQLIRECWPSHRADMRKEGVI